VGLGDLSAWAPEVTVTVVVPRVGASAPVVMQLPIEIPQDAHRLPVALEVSVLGSQVRGRVATAPGAVVQGLCVDADLAVDAEALGRFWHTWSPSAIAAVPAVPAVTRFEGSHAPDFPVGPPGQVRAAGEGSIGTPLATAGVTRTADAEGKVVFSCAASATGTMAVMVNASTVDKFGYARRDVQVSAPLHLDAPSDAAAATQVVATVRGEGRVGVRVGERSLAGEREVRLSTAMPRHALRVQAVSGAGEVVERVVRLRADPVGASVGIAGPAPVRLELHAEGASALEVVMGNTPMAAVAVAVRKLIESDDGSPRGAAARVVGLTVPRALVPHLGLPELPDARARHRRAREAVRSLLRHQRDDGGFGGPAESVDGALALVLARESGTWVPPRSLDRALRHLHRFEHHVREDLPERDRVVARAWYVRGLAGETDPAPSTGLGPYSGSVADTAARWEAAAMLWVCGRSKCPEGRLQSLAQTLADHRNPHGDWGDDTLIAVVAWSEYARSLPRGQGEWYAWLGARGIFLASADRKSPRFARVVVPADLLGGAGDLVIAGSGGWWASATLLRTADSSR
jgi:hypothetical protein